MPSRRIAPKTLCDSARQACYSRSMRAQLRKPKSGVYAGSFDPLTVGHMWMIEQGARLFDRLTVAVGVNPDKKYTFSVEERLDMLRESTTGFANVSVAS